MAEFWFAYAPFSEDNFIARVLGRPVDKVSARLPGYRLVADAAYPHVLLDPESEVEGQLVPVKLGDDWLLDAEFGVAESYYRRLTLEVSRTDGKTEAWVMVGGPSLSWAMQEDTESA